MRYFQINVRKNPTEHGFMPTLQLYLVENSDKLRPIVIIAPGGGYTILVDSDRDRIAMQFNAAGFHAAVLNYSVEPHHFPTPQQDLMSAIQLVREHASEWGILENGIAICGFSAGGHLCASVSTLWHRLGNEKCRPNAAILCYGILTSKLNHCKMFLQDHVGSDNAEKLKLVSSDEQVSEYTPPTFLYNTFEDKLTNVENVLYYAESLKKHGIPFEMHVFPKGAHGTSWCDGTIWATPAQGRDTNYIHLSIEWMRELFGLIGEKS